MTGTGGGHRTSTPHLSGEHEGSYIHHASVHYSCTTVLSLGSIFGSCLVGGFAWGVQNLLLMYHRWCLWEFGPEGGNSSFPNTKNASLPVLKRVFVFRHDSLVTQVFALN